MREVPNPYATDEARLRWYRRFALSPTDPDAIADRLAAGESLETTDLPTYLAQKAHTDAETGACLYRLVQLWGTPNVPGTTAGALARERDLTTWQYLFDVTYDRRDDEDEAVPAAFRLSVYDHKTDVSAGLSGFRASGDGPGVVREPVPSAVAPVSMPPDAFLVGVVGLVLNMVDEPVPATFKELWV